MSSRTIEASIDAWLPTFVAFTPADLGTVEALPLINSFGYATNNMAPEWLKVGTARITVEIANINGLIETQITTLKEAREKVLADASTTRASAS